MQQNHFIIIGSQRCGTTYLCNVLNSHPQIKMAKPFKPEPKFFLKLNEFELGYGYYLEKYFSENKNAQLFGEKSTSYFEYDYVADRINRLMPECKILVVFRNPVNRAISNYHFSKNNNLETRTLEEVFFKNIPPPDNKIVTSVSPFNYLERGIYVNFLDPYRELFGDRLKVLIFEELVSNEKEFSGLYKFLGINAEFKSELIQKKFNDSEKPSGSNQDLDMENRIRKYLKTYYADSVAKLESGLKRKIQVWNDPLQ